MTVETTTQTCTWPAWFRALFLVLAAVPLPLFVLLEGWTMAWVGALVTASLLFVWWRLARVDVRVDPEGVQYGFTGLRRRIPWSRVRSVTAETYRALRYGGWGYRMAGWRDRAYSVLGVPRGLRVEFEDERGRDASVFLSCPDPDALVAAANRKISFR